MKGRCLVCESRSLKEIYKDLYDKTHFKEGKFSLIQCENCKLEFIDPLLDEKQLGKYYPNNYYSFVNEDGLVRWYDKLSAYLHSGKFGSLFLLPFKPFLASFFTLKKDKGKRILEIGCGNGLMLEVYQKYGLITAGLEPYGSKLTEKEKKLGIKRRSIEKASFKEKFDYIILREVLEHIPNPKKVLEKCREWIKEDGTLVIEMPNTNSLWRRKFKKNWFGYDVPRHVYNYNPKNISLFLRKLGFRVEKIRIFDLPYMLYGSLQFQRTKNKKVKEISAGLKLAYFPISLILSFTKAGSLMEIKCKKNKNVSKS